MTSSPPGRGRSRCARGGVTDAETTRGVSRRGLGMSPVVNFTPLPPYVWAGWGTSTLTPHWVPRVSQRLKILEDKGEGLLDTTPPLSRCHLRPEGPLGLECTVYTVNGGSRLSSTGDEGDRGSRGP